MEYKAVDVSRKASSRSASIHGGHVTMQALTLFFLAALVAMTYAAGQYYVPRAYYIIDQDGNESPPIPLRRLRRSLRPYPNYYPGSSASANANANANAWAGGGGNANANANARADAGGWGSGSGGWGVPNQGGYGASNPALGASLTAGQTRRQSGPILGARSVSAGSSVGLDSSGSGYYDQYTSVQP